MPINIQDVLTYEIKKEIADRYFGFRKLIEEDTLDLKEKARQHRFILEKRISFDLIRLYILFRDENIIREFLFLIDLKEDLFYEPYLAESETIKTRVFQGTRIRGFTWRGRYKNLIFDTYERLEVHIKQYLLESKEMQELSETIQEEIKIFHKNNDLGNIMGFLRSLDKQSIHGKMQGGMEVGIAESLQKKLQIASPVLQSSSTAIIKPIPPLSSIKSSLKDLIKQAYRHHGEAFRLFFAKELASPHKLPR